MLAPPAEAGLVVAILGQLDRVLREVVSRDPPRGGERLEAFDGRVGDEVGRRQHIDGQTLATKQRLGLGARTAERQSPAGANGAASSRYTARSTARRTASASPPRRVTFLVW